MSSINSLRYIRDYLKTNKQTKMIPNTLRPGGAELKPRGSISMAMAVSNRIFPIAKHHIFFASWTRTLQKYLINNLSLSLSLSLLFSAEGEQTGSPHHWSWCHVHLWDECCDSSWWRICCRKGDEKYQGDAHHLDWINDHSSCRRISSTMFLFHHCMKLLFERSTSSTLQCMICTHAN